MKLGDLQIDIVSGGKFRIDGGTMFGVVPKALWSRIVPPDDDNLIAQDTNCLLVRSSAGVVLIDTGFGGKLPAKMRRLLSAEDGDPLTRNLQQLGVRPEDVDTVILSHLHFDHAGGATTLDEAGNLTAAFSNAEYVVQRGEWELATSEAPELRGAYPPENFRVLASEDRLRLIDGETEILTGVHAQLTPGHTRWHQSLVVEDGDRAIVYMGDVCPSPHHLRTLWCMAYDTEMVETRRQKPALLGRAVDQDWIVVFDHDPQIAAARLARHDRKDFEIAEPIEF